MVKKYILMMLQYKKNNGIDDPRASGVDRCGNRYY